MNNPYNIETIPFKQGNEDDSRLVKAAIAYNFNTYIGWRHFMILDYMREIGIVKEGGSWNWQGFVDQYGNFFNRSAGLYIATEAKQLPPQGIIGGDLTSEDLWDSSGVPTVKP